MKEYKEGIKVLRQEGRKLFSCFSDGKDVRYKENLWNKRPKDCGPLAVFDTIENAENFKNLIGRRVFYSCKYVESKDKKLWAWKNYGFANLRRNERDSLPNGTQFADKVKLIKRIEQNGTFR